MGTLMAQWGIVVAFGGSMAALVTSFQALTKPKREKYSRRFKSFVAVISIGVIMQIVAITWL